MGAATCTSPLAGTDLGMGPAAAGTVTLSDRAANHIANFLAKRGKGLGIKLGVRTSGCSGMAYKLEFVDVEDPEDTKFVSNGVCVYVDPKSLTYLAGTELDYVREGLNEGFKFNNPNVKSACGCGESFNV
jgi:iron-sulfur cluster assembly protein